MNLAPTVIKVQFTFQTSTFGIYYDIGQHIMGDMNYVDAPPSGVAKVSSHSYLE